MNSAYLPFCYHYHWDEKYLCGSAVCLCADNEGDHCSSITCDYHQHHQCEGFLINWAVMTDVRGIMGRGLWRDRRASRKTQLARMHPFTQRGCHSNKVQEHSEALLKKSTQSCDTDVSCKQRVRDSVIESKHFRILIADRCRGDEVHHQAWFCSLWPDGCVYCQHNLVI